MRRFAKDTAQSVWVGSVCFVGEGLRGFPSSLKQSSIELRSEGSLAAAPGAPRGKDPMISTAAMVVAAAAVLILGSGAWAGQLSAQEGGELGQITYEKWCAGCHGEDGAGAGPAANTMLPRPRDFTLALYQVRTTSSGELPTDADMLKVINEAHVLGQP